MQGVCVNIYNKFIVNFSTNSVLRKIHGILRRVSVYRELHYEQGKKLYCCLDFAICVCGG